MQRRQGRPHHRRFLRHRRGTVAHMHHPVLFAVSCSAPTTVTDHIQIIRRSSSLTDLSLQQLAYQYALNRASLALVARRESSLRHVADRALELGARDVVVLPGDVSAPDDCDRFVRTAISHYDRCECMRSTPSTPNMFNLRVWLCGS